LSTKSDHSSVQNREKIKKFLPPIHKRVTKIGGRKKGPNFVSKVTIRVIIEGRVFLQPSFRDCPPDAFVLKINDFGHSDLLRLPREIAKRYLTGGFRISTVRRPVECFEFHPAEACNIKVVLNILFLIKRTIIRLLLIYRRARYGFAFRLIPMSQPKYAKVDPADYERLRKYEWLAWKGKNRFYARRRVPTGIAKKEKLVYMHQMVIKVPDGMVTDHINHEGMDNRSANLRAATKAQNLCNRKKFAGSSSSKYKGVCWLKRHHKWEACITLKNKKIYLGCSRDEIEAAKAYVRAAKKYHGDFACLNFPDAK
jgi:hypothetical protein